LTNAHPYEPGSTDSRGPVSAGGLATASLGARHRHAFGDA
jgi:hypothetical protein